MNNKSDILIKLCLIIFSLVMMGGLFTKAIEFNKEMNKEQNTITETRKTYLVSLDYQTRVEGQYRGNFRMGYGRFDEVDYYVAYKKLDDGGKVLLKIESSNTVIYDRLEKDDTAYLAEYLNGFGFVVKRELHVPEGSITQSYDFNLSDN